MSVKNLCEEIMVGVSLLYDEILVQVIEGIKEPLLAQSNMIDRKLIWLDSNE
jgi:hypothetical protein